MQFYNIKKDHNEYKRSARDLSYVTVQILNWLSTIDI